MSARSRTRRCSRRRGAWAATTALSCVSLEPHTLDDVLATVELVAGLAGVEERGSEVVADLRQRLAAVELPIHRRRVAAIEWLDPLFAPGHWVPEQVARAGGIPVIGWAEEPSRELAWKALAETDPEVIVLGLCGFDLPAASASGARLNLRRSWPPRRPGRADSCGRSTARPTCRGPARG